MLGIELGNQAISQSIELHLHLLEGFLFLPNWAGLSLPVRSVNRQGAQVWMNCVRFRSITDISDIQSPLMLLLAHICDSFLHVGEAISVAKSTWKKKTGEEI